VRYCVGVRVETGNVVVVAAAAAWTEQGDFEIIIMLLFVDCYSEDSRYVELESIGLRVAYSVSSRW
jgi:hypothetical protein